jgi:hypothetical protein
MTVHVLAAETLVKGATLEVVLIDGAGRRMLFLLRDVATPPAEVLLDRPADCPALLERRDPAFVYFRLRPFIDWDGDGEAAGKPIYDQVVRDDADQDDVDNG